MWGRGNLFIGIFIDINPIRRSELGRRMEREGEGELGEGRGNAGGGGEIVSPSEKQFLSVRRFSFIQSKSSERVYSIIDIYYCLLVRAVIV